LIAALEGARLRLRSYSDDLICVISAACRYDCDGAGSVAPQIHGHYRNRAEWWRQTAVKPYSSFRGRCFVLVRGRLGETPRLARSVLMFRCRSQSEGGTGLEKTYRYFHVCSFFPGCGCGGPNYKRDRAGASAVNRPGTLPWWNYLAARTRNQRSLLRESLGDTQKKWWEGFQGIGSSQESDHTALRAGTYDRAPFRGQPRNSAGTGTQQVGHINATIVADD